MKYVQYYDIMLSTNKKQRSTKHMSKILIADDEQKILKLVGDFLINSGYEVIEAEDGDEAHEAFAANVNDIDLVILDIMMPGLNGWEVCKKIRQVSNVPVIFLTARSEEFDELMGYEAGADDYITKPFSPSVLVKKVEALLKRTKLVAPQVEKKINNLTFNHDAHEVKLGNQRIDLALKEYNLLNKLIESPGRVFSREQILTTIWGFDFVGDERTVDSHVARIRTKLGDWGNKHIKTVYGVGYKIEED